MRETFILGLICDEKIKEKEIEKEGQIVVTRY